MKKSLRNTCYKSFGLVEKHHTASKSSGFNFGLMESLCISKHQITLVGCAVFFFLGCGLSRPLMVMTVAPLVSKCTSPGSWKGLCFLRDLSFVRYIVSGTCNSYLNRNYLNHTLTFVKCKEIY